ncbi:XRE family transcriptional regulator [Alteromonadaceae bacterium M269]|nr:XRE family transcriptional regulator [Alteromonadaceae bacterium M269]
MMDRENFKGIFIRGHDLRDIRLYANKSIEQMAALAQVKQTDTYKDWEDGLSEPSHHQLIDLALGCGISPTSLLKAVFERGDKQESLDLNMI